MANIQSGSTKLPRAARKTGKKPPVQKKSEKEKVIDVKLKSTQSRNKQKATRDVSNVLAPKDGNRPAVESATASVGDKPQVGVISAPDERALAAFQQVSRRNKEDIRKRRAGANKMLSKFMAAEPTKGRKFAVDLRIHSPASVGYFSTGGIETGEALVRLSKVKGLEIIAVTDYYTASFVDLVKDAAHKVPLTVIPGVDFRCVLNNCREVFITALFPEELHSKDICNVLQELKIPPEAYGRSDYCYSGSFGRLLEIVEKNGGVVIPTRLDKTPYRQLAIPTLVETYGFHAFDLVHCEHTDFFRSRWPNGEFTFFSFSNANSLAQIGSRSSSLKLTSPRFEAIRARVARRV